jgi:hypothetical protein
MTSMANLRKVVEWGIKEGHTVSEIAQGLDLDYMTVGTVYMQIMSDRKDLPAHLRHQAPRAERLFKEKPQDATKPITDIERARNDPRYQAWLNATTGARATRRGNL